MISCKSPHSWWLVVLALVGVLPSHAASPSKLKFEQDRKILFQRIETINQILAQTESKKKTNTGQLMALNKKLETNNSLVSSLSHEVKAINQQLHQQLQKIYISQTELTQLKKEYAKILFLGAKSMQDINMLVFVFSAASFQELLQRLRATKQYIKIRKKHFQEIKKIDLQLHAQRIELEKQSHRKKLLLQERQIEQQKLHALKQKQHKVMVDLEQKYVELVKELNKKNEAIKHLDKLIFDIVNRELEAQTSTPKLASPSTPDAPAKQVLTAAAKALALQFTQCRGTLPWPVKNGFISNKFGRRMHPVLHNIQVENLGIDIQTQEKATVHAICRGIVKTTSFVPGINRVVIIQHGNYHTVYAKLGVIQVKVGQEVQIGEPIGIIYTDKNGVSELQFQIWKDNQKLNPAIWITKQPS